MNITNPVMAFFQIYSIRICKEAAKIYKKKELFLQNVP